jgi:hypothetical protein
MCAERLRYVQMCAGWLTTRAFVDNKNIPSEKGGESAPDISKQLRTEPPTTTSILISHASRGLKSCGLRAFKYSSQRPG